MKDLKASLQKYQGKAQAEETLAKSKSQNFGASA
jgi:hypothetical protein